MIKNLYLQEHWSDGNTGYIDYRFKYLLEKKKKKSADTTAQAASQDANFDQQVTN